MSVSKQDSLNLGGPNDWDCVDGGAFSDDFEFIDDIHGPVHLNRLERDIIDTPEFQRLFRLGQLGFVDLVYPTANHTRGAHSIGACFWAKKLTKTLNDNRCKVNPGTKKVPTISPAENVLISLGALTHDLPHGPFSHDIEKKTHWIYPQGLQGPKRRVISYYGPYDKHDNFLSNPALYVFLMDVENSVLARVLRKYSRDFSELLLRDAASYEHLAEFGRLISLGDWPDFASEALPSLLFHLLIYEKYSDALTFSERLIKTFESKQSEEWGLGPFGARKALHEAWYQPFRHDIIGDTLSADLLDYLMRDQSRLGMKNELDLKLLNYYVLVAFHDEAKSAIPVPVSEASGEPAEDDHSANLATRTRYRCAIDLYDHKRGTFRSERLNDVFRLLDFRHQIHEKAVYHRVVQSAIAMLSRTGLILKDNMPRVSDLYGFGQGTGALAGDEYFLDLLIRANAQASKDAPARLRDGSDLHQSLPCKLAERRVYRPLMVIPGDRVTTLLKDHYGVNDKVDLILRELAAIVDSAFFSPFFLLLSALIEALLKHAIESEEKVDSFLTKLASNPAHLAVVSKVVPKSVIFWTTPYKQLYKDPAILVCASENVTTTIDDLQGETSISEPLRKRVQAGIADAEAKNEGMWKLYVFLSDGLFYTGACAKALPNHPCAASAANHEGHLVMAQNIVVRALRCAWEYWQVRGKNVELNELMTLDDLILLINKFVADDEMFKFQRDDIRPFVSAVNVAQYLHGDDSPRCRDVRYKFDAPRPLTQVLESVVEDKSTRTLVREAMHRLGLEGLGVRGEELSEIVVRFARHKHLLPDLISTRDRPKVEELVREIWLGDLSPRGTSAGSSEEVSGPVASATPEQRLERFGGICRIVLRNSYANHEHDLLSRYRIVISELDDVSFIARMEEFERSAKGTPAGVLVKNRRAAGPEDSDFYKLRSFLDELFQ